MSEGPTLRDDGNAEFSLDLRVYIEDTDAGGIVYYVNYLKFMERSRTEWLRGLGFDKSYIFDQDIMFVVRDVAVTYLKSAVLDDCLAVTAALRRLSGAVLVVEQRIQRGSETLAEASITLACVARHSGVPRRIPKNIVRALAGA